MYVLDFTVPYNETILWVIQGIITDIGVSPKRKLIDYEGVRKTYLEHVLDLFVERGEVGVSHLQLKRLLERIGRTENTEAALKNLLYRFNCKLKPYGYTVGSYIPKEDHQWYYWIGRLDPELE